MIQAHAFYADGDRAGWSFHETETDAREHAAWQLRRGIDRVELRDHRGTFAMIRATAKAAR